MKLKNSKNGSILRTITRRTLITPIVAIFIFSVIALIGILILKGNTVNVSENLGNMSAESSKAALELQSKAELTAMAKNKAIISDNKMSKVQNYVGMIAESAARIVDNPGQYAPQVVQKADPGQVGTYSVQLQYAESMNYEAMKSKIALMGNIQSILLNIPHNDSEVIKTYVGTEDGFFIVVDQFSDTKTEYFDPRERPWYTNAVKTGDVCWSDVMDDQGGQGLSIVCSKPIYDKEGKLVGVAGIGMLLKSLNETILNTRIGENGFASVINQEGKVIISPLIKKDDQGNIMRGDLWALEDEGLKGAAADIAEGVPGWKTVNLEGTEYFMAYTPMEVLPWSIATFVPVEEVLKPAVAIETRIIAATNEAIGDINMVMIVIFLSLLASSVAMIGAIAAVARKSARNIAAPILKLTEGARVISGGDLSHKVEIQTGDEIEALAETFNKMIDDIQSITSEKERIGAELDVAKNIQASMLPGIFPAFPEREELDIYATMLPAKEVGGDFYDFFLVDEKRLGIVMADVSGKGVPAALFMVIAKTLIKNYSQMGLSPAEVFERANNQLCEGNDAAMFVTAFMGIIDLETGVFRFVNAGHNPPCIKRRGGEFQWLTLPSGFVLAGMEGMKYKETTVNFERGDMIYMYTDGVTEAMNAQDELFSEERLLEVLNQHTDSNPENLLMEIKKAIDDFVLEAPQVDDITMLAFAYLSTQGVGPEQ